MAYFTYQDVFKILPCSACVKISLFSEMCIKFCVPIYQLISILVVFFFSHWQGCFYEHGLANIYSNLYTKSLVCFLGMPSLNHTLILSFWRTIRLPSNVLVSITFPLVIHKSVNFSTLVIFWLLSFNFDCSHCKGHEITVYCGVDSHFPNDYWCWVYWLNYEDPKSKFANVAVSPSCQRS